jgi:putative holliday junction resolvase
MPGVKAAGLDFGQARVGLAVSDELGLLAHPRPHLDGRELSSTLTKLASLSKEEGWTHIVVGMPRNLDGTFGLAARKAQRFAALVKQATKLPVVLVDERLSTREAQSRLTASGVDARQSRSKIDSAAAAILLQMWLDQNAHGGSDGGALE